MNTSSTNAAWSTNQMPSTSTTKATSASQMQPKQVSSCRATQTTPVYSRLLPGEPCCLDIEFQKYKVTNTGSSTKERHRIGRIAIVNTLGETVYDAFAIYSNEPNVEKRWQPAIFGVSARDLKFENGGVHASKVERVVKNLVANRTVVVHGGKNDLDAFYLEKDVWAKSKIVDTQKMYSDWQIGGQPGLPMLAECVLGIEDFRGEGEHSPVEDAKATMELFMLESNYQRPGAEGKQKQKTKAEKAQAREQKKSQRPLPYSASGLYTTGGAPLDV